MEVAALSLPSVAARQPERDSVPEKGLPMNVLVIDDAMMVRQRLRAAFRKAEGIDQILEAGSGEEALELLRDFKADLITLDLMLPGMSGLETLEEIRKLDTEVKIVIFTNYPYPAFRRKCIALGATQFFGKSTEVERILEAVRADPSPLEKEESADGDPA